MSYFNHIKQVLSCFKVILLLIALIWSSPGFAIDCKIIETEFAPVIKRLRKIIDAQEGNRAFLLSDSILTALDERHATSCTLATWVNYYKADALCSALKVDKALELCYNTIKVAEQQEEWEIVALCYIDAALCLEVMQRPNDCRRHLNSAYEIIKKKNLVYAESVFAIRYSSYHRIYENKDTAVFYAKKAVELGKQVGPLRSIADGYLLLGALEGDPLKSIEYGKNAIEAFIQSENFLGAAVMFTNIAFKYRSLNDEKNQLKGLDSSLFYFAKIESKTEEYFQMLDVTYNMKIQHFSKLGLSDSVQYYNTLSNQARAGAKLNFNQIKIENDVVEFAIAKEKAKAETIEQRNFFLKMGLILISSLLILILWLFYNNFKKTAKIKNQIHTINIQNDQLQKLINKQNVLLSEVHHRVKNNLQLVISMITVLSRKLGNNGQSQLLNDITSKVHSMALIHEQLYKRNDFEVIELLEYIYEMSENFKALHSDRFKMQIISSSPKIESNIDTAIPLGIILTELFSNSLKYALVPDRPLQIRIELNLTDHIYTLKYSDNGPGLNQQVLSHGDGNMGFSIIQKMARQLQAQTNMYNENGAVFTIVFEEKKLSEIAK